MTADDWERAKACVNALAGMEPEAVGKVVEALNIMLQAYDLYHPAACTQACFDTSDSGCGIELQRAAVESSYRALAKLRGGTEPWVNARLAEIQLQEKDGGA
jgi:hypothetical protein